MEVQGHAAQATGLYDLTGLLYRLLIAVPSGVPPDTVAPICVGSLLIFAEYRELSPLSGRPLP
jgi:hypothetical protein